MPLAVEDIDTLKRYVEGVMGRSAHHAGEVGGAVLALAGAIVWRKDDSESIEVYVRSGNTANVLWVRIGGQRYAFSYNHEQQTVEMRRGSTQGPVLHSFTNDTPTNEIEKIFRSL